MPNATPTATLETAASTLATVAEELGLPKLGATIEQDTRRRLKDGRLRVLMLGEIKHGKSSLINALLGRRLLPIGVTPTTAAIVSVRTGNDLGHYRVTQNGRRESIDAQTFERFARGELREEGAAELVCEPLTLPDGVELIDTPGFNDIDRFRSALSRGELPRADVLVLVLDATQILTRTEVDLLREAISAVGGLQDSGASVELVINRIDLVSESDRPTLVAHLRKQLVDVLGELPRPYLTDARSALRDPESEDLPVAELRRLRGRLRHLAGVRAQILPARVRSSLLRHERLLEYNAAIQARALTLETQTLSQEIEAVSNALEDNALDLDTLKVALSAASSRVLGASTCRISAFHEDFARRTVEQIKKADLRSLTDAVPGAIQDAFLEFVRVESESLRRDLDELTDEVLRTHGDLSRRRLAEATMHLGFRGPSIYVELPSLKVEVGMIALGLVGTAVMYFGNTTTGMVMTIASPLTTVLLREKSLRDARAQALEIVPQALRTTMRALSSSVEEVIANYADALTEHIDLANEALGEQLLATLNRARTRLEAFSPPNTEDDASTEGDASTEDDAREDRTASEDLARLEAKLGAVRETLLHLDLGSAYRVEHEEADDKPIVVH